MPNEEVQAKLVEYLEDAHATERNVHQMPKSMISTTDDEEVKRELEHHLERVAQRAGDDVPTVDVARRNRADEEAMAQKIASNWDRFVTLTLEEEGVAVT